MIYWILLIIIAIVAYCFGSISSISIASQYVFRSNLRKLGKGNAALSNFRRIYGTKGLLMMLGTEVVKDLVPLLFGGLLMGLKDHADVGFAFAGFCLIMGRLWPVFNRLRGSHAAICVIVMAFCCKFSLGMTALVVTAAVIWLTKYVSVGTVAGAAAMAVIAVLALDERLVILLCVFAGAAVIVKHIPALSRVLNGKETKLSLEEDITYKLDNKF